MGGGSTFHSIFWWFLFLVFSSFFFVYSFAYERSDCPTSCLLCKSVEMFIITHTITYLNVKLEYNFWNCFFFCTRILLTIYLDFLILIWLCYHFESIISIKTHTLGIIRYHDWDGLASKTHNLELHYSTTNYYNPSMVLTFPLPSQFLLSKFCQVMQAIRKSRLMVMWSQFCLSRVAEPFTRRRVLIMASLL